MSKYVIHVKGRGIYSGGKFHKQNLALLKDVFQGDEYKHCEIKKDFWHIKSILDNDTKTNTAISGSKLPNKRFQKRKC